MTVPRQQVGQLIGGAAAGAALAGYLLWQYAHRGPFQYAQGIYHLDDADEWRYTACSRLVEHGYRLFDQVFSAQPPALFLSLAAGMRLFGDSISGAHRTEVAFGVLALLAAAWVSWLIAGPVAAGVSALLLAVSPGFLIYSRAVEAEMPMAALVTLSLALCLVYRRRSVLALPVAAGLVLACAILMKFFAIETFLPAGWILLRGPRGERHPAHVAAFVASALVPVGAEMALVSPARQWSQAVALHEKASHVFLPNLIPPLQILADFLSFDLGLTLLAIGGLAVLAILGVWDDAIFLALWLLGSIVMLVLFRPLFPHHAAILLPALAVSAGSAVTVWVEQLRSHRWLAAVPLSVLVLFYLALSPRILHDDRHALVPGVAPARLVLATYTVAHVSASDLVAADDLAVPDLAQRLVVPGLCDPSTVRLRAGYLTPADLIVQTRRYRPRLVLSSSGTFAQVPRYLDWLRNQYRPVPAPAGAHAFIRR